MKAKLIKLFNGYILNVDNLTISSTIRDAYGSIPHNLSKQNCDELFGVVDVEKLAASEYREFPTNPKDRPYWDYNRDINCYRKRKAYIKGFNKAMELNKDKVFTLEDMNRAMEVTLNYELKRDAQSYQEKIDFLKSLQQPTEIEVTFNPEEKDSDGCLILSKL